MNPQEAQAPNTQASGQLAPDALAATLAHVTNLHEQSMPQALQEAQPEQATEAPQEPQEPQGQAEAPQTENTAPKEEKEPKDEDKEVMKKVSEIETDLKLIKQLLTKDVKED